MGRNFCLAGLLLAASAALAQSGERTLSLVPKQATGGEARTALVIGNGAYANGPLRNPVNDARAMARTLREFQVHGIEIDVDSGQDATDFTSVVTTINLEMPSDKRLLLPSPGTPGEGLGVRAEHRQGLTAQQF